MSVLDKIDEYITRTTPKKKIIKESTDINADILDLLNSLDDSMLDETQIELKERILSANFETEEDDISVDEGDIIDDADNIEDDGQVSAEDEPIGLDDIIDDDLPVLSNSDEIPEDSLTGVEMEDAYFDSDKYKVEGKVVKKGKAAPKKQKNNKEPERVGKSKKKK